MQYLSYYIGSHKTSKSYNCRRRTDFDEIGISVQLSQISYIVLTAIATIRQKQMMKIDLRTAAADAAAWFYWRDRNDGSKALVTAPSDADRTSEAYFARTPLV
jgi:hypothetical protein